MYASFDNVTTKITGFYRPDINISIPDGAVEITDDDWRLALDHMGRSFINPTTGRVGVENIIPSSAELKIIATSEIDARAEKSRLRFITAGTGQALVYQRKEAQARACLATYDSNSPPPLTTYPALDAEIGLTGEDTLAVAQTVAGLADAWGAIADQIETLRLTGKRDIDLVSDEAADIEAQIAAIVDGIVWPPAA